VTIQILPADDEEGAVWATALHVSDLFAGVPWILIGAQMVMLLEREGGRSSGRTTGDVDAIVDVRVLAGGMRAAAERLVAAGFEPSVAEHPYRFERGDEQVDLLAPDHLGPRADLTTIPPAITTEIPGGSRALGTARSLEVEIIGIRSGTLPVPSLAGAIVLKVRAWESRRETRDAEDLARLLGLVVDVETVRSELIAADRRALGRVGPLSDPAHRAWGVTPTPDDALAAFARLSD
jgi:predicted nucleotidyltransferase